MLVATEDVIESAGEAEEADRDPGGKDTDASPTNAESPKRRRRSIRWRSVLAYGLLPGLAVVMAMASGYLKWYGASAHECRVAAAESVRAASEGAIAMLSYRPDTVEKDLDAARDRLTSPLKDSYSSLTHDVVIPGSRQKAISASATVPAAASVSASPNHAVALLFVDQTIIVGNDPPTNSASRVRVTLDKIAGRWRISSFDPL